MIRQTARIPSFRGTKKELYLFLEEKHDQYNRPDFIGSDPIFIPHQFSKKQDIEIAGFLAATIAWGKRPSIIKNSNELMQRMDFVPYDFILGHTKKDLLQFEKFKHRTFNGIDCIFFLKSLKNIYKKYGGLENIFLSPHSFGGNSPFSPSRSALAERGERVVLTQSASVSTGDVAMRSAITNFRKVFFSISHPNRTRKHVSAPPSPISNSMHGSACKRLNMFLRWMVRKDNRRVDFGIWNNIKMSELMCPLDVHSGNIARKLGLITRKQNNWQAVVELTNRLKEFDSNDPVKYDFALFGLGVFESNPNR